MTEQEQTQPVEQIQPVLEKIYPNTIMKGLEDKIGQFSESTGLSRDVHPLFFLPNDYVPLFEQANQGKTSEQRVNAKEQLGGLMHQNPDYYLTSKGERDFVRDKQYLMRMYTEQLPKVIEANGNMIRTQAFAYYEDKLREIYQKVDEEKDEKKRKVKQAEAESEISQELMRLLLSIDPKDKRIEAIVKAERLLQEEGDPKILKELIEDMYGKDHAGYFMNQISGNPENLSQTAQMYMRIKQKELVDSYRNEQGRIDIEKIRSDLEPRLGQNPRGYEHLVKGIYERANTRQGE